MVVVTSPSGFVTRNSHDLAGKRAAQTLPDPEGRGPRRVDSLFPLPSHPRAKPMKEMAEFRLFEEQAVRYLSPQVGVCVDGMVRKVVLPISSPVVKQMIDLHHTLLRQGDRLYIFSDIRRRYSKQEILDAAAVMVVVNRVFEPTGEQCGTISSDENACPYCGAGRQQVADLILDARSLSSLRNTAIAKTLGGEIVVAKPFRDLFEANRLDGAEFQVIRDHRDPQREIPNWYQLRVTSSQLNIVSPTRVGETPFDDEVLRETAANDALHRSSNLGTWSDDDGEYRCPVGHTIGLNLFSEVTATLEDQSPWDVSLTRQWIGVRRGVLRPQPLVVISNKCLRLIQNSGLKGMTFEVVHLV
jgi:hypothetical protein